jgi:hypothetical protein
VTGNWPRSCTVYVSMSPLWAKRVGKIIVMTFEATYDDDREASSFDYIEDKMFGIRND